MSNKLVHSLTSGNLFSKWKIAIDEGKLDQAEEISIKYLDLLLRKRCTLKALSFIDEIKLIKTKNPKILKYEILFTLLLGDNEKLEIYFPNIVEEYQCDKSITYISYKKYNDILKLSGINWVRNHIGYKYHFINELKEYREENSLKIIKNFIFCISNYPNDRDFVFLLLDFSIKTSRKIMGEKCLHILKDLYLSSEQYLKYEKDLSLLDEDKDYSKVDLGTDLFKSQSDKESVRLLMNELDIAVKSNDLKKQETLKSQLKVIDRDNTTLFDLDKIDFVETHESISNEDTSLLFKKVIHSLNTDRYDDNFLNNEKHFIVVINNYSEDEIIDTYEDFVVIFNQMKFFRISMLIFTRVENLIDMNDYRERLAYTFLLIETLRKRGKYFLALNEIDILFEEIPLLKEEIKCYLYIKGEILFTLKKYSDALVLFKKVMTIDQSYRLAKVRVREIEKN